MKKTESIYSTTQPKASTSAASQTINDYLPVIPTIHYALDNVGESQAIYNGTKIPTDDMRPTFHGSAGAGETVTLYSGNTVLGSVKADSSGKWSLEITTELTNGSHAVVARTETHESSRFTFKVETTANEPVTIRYVYDNVGEKQTIYNNSTTKTDDTRPTFTGRAGAGQIVTLYSGDIVLGSVQADANGSWNLKIDTDLTSGAHSVIARTDTRASDTFNLNVEAAVDTPVTIRYAFDNVGQQQTIYSTSTSKTDDTRPTFTGRAGAGQVVTLYSGDIVLGSVQADNKGSWSLEIATELTSGTNAIVARTATQASDAFSLFVETPADVPVTIRYALDNVGQQQTIYSNSTSKTDDARPTFTGRAGAGQVVTLYSGNTVLGSVQADSNGNWSLEITTELTSGSHAVVARTETRESSQFNLNVETAADVPVTISYAQDNIGRIQTIHNNSGVKTDDTRPTFFGRAGPDQIVTLYSGDTLLGSVRADKNGNWFREISAELMSGAHTVVARTATQESNAFNLIVEAPADAPVTISYAFDNVGQQQTLYSGSNKSTDDTRPTFHGLAGVQQVVTLYCGDTVLGSARADSTGNWRLEISTELVSGNHAIIARTENRESNPFTLDVLTAADQPVTITYAYDNVGQAQTIISGSGVKTDDTRPTFYGRAGAEQMVTLYSGDTVLGSVRADRSGYWSLEISTELTSGAYNVVARTATRESDDFKLIVEEPIDTPVTITHAMDNVGAHEALYSGSRTSTDDTRPTFYGRAGLHQVVTLYSGDTVLGSVQADRYGNWSLEIATELTRGDHAIVARTEKRGSDDFILNVVIGTPVVITHAVDNVGQEQTLRSDFGFKTDDTRPTFFGRAGADEIVTLYSGTTVLGSVRADENGNWSLEITTELASGAQRIVARSEFRESSNFNFTVETAAEAPVTILYGYDDVGEERSIYHNSSRTTDDTRPTFYGRAGSEQIVTLYLGDTILGSVQAEKDGLWSLEITSDLVNGTHNIIARTETRTSDAFTFTVDATADVIITHALDNVGEHRYFYNGSGANIDDARPTFFGSAGPEQIVTLYTHTGLMLGSVQADRFGNWNMEITTDLPRGAHAITAHTATNVSDRFTGFFIDTGPGTPVTITHAIDNVDEFGFISNGSKWATDDTRPTFHGRAGSDEIVTLYSGTTVLGSTKASSTGNWELEITTELVDGANTIIAKTATQQSQGFVVTVEVPASVYDVEANFSLTLFADVLIDNSISLFDDNARISAEEELVLTINETDMQFESNEIGNYDLNARSHLMLNEEEQNYLVNAI